MAGTATRQAASGTPWSSRGSPLPPSPLATASLRGEPDSHFYRLPHGLRVRDVALASAASALMLFGLWSTIINQLPS